VSDDLPPSYVAARVVDLLDCLRGGPVFVADLPRQHRTEVRDAKWLRFVEVDGMGRICLTRLGRAYTTIDL